MSQQTLPGIAPAAPSKGRAYRQAAVDGTPTGNRSGRGRGVSINVPRDARDLAEATRIAKERAEEAAAEVHPSLWAERPVTRGDCFRTRVACGRCRGLGPNGCLRCRGTGLHFLRGVRGKPGAVERFDEANYRALVESIDRGLPLRSLRMRPCPWASCSQSLLLHVEDHGRIKLNVLRPKATCALDVADRGGVTLRYAGKASGAGSKERARQIARDALASLPGWAKRKLGHHDARPKREVADIDDSDYADNTGMAAE